MREMQELSAEPRPGPARAPPTSPAEKGLIPGHPLWRRTTRPKTSRSPQRDLERHVETGTFLDHAVHARRGRQEDSASFRAQCSSIRSATAPCMSISCAWPKGAKVKLAIPVRFKGQEISPGLKRGGVLNIVRHEVEMLCPAENIPDFIEGDLSGLDIHGTLHISDFKLPEGVKPADPRARLHHRLHRGADQRHRRAARAAAAAAARRAPVVEAAPRLPKRGCARRRRGACRCRQRAGGGRAKAPEKK